jgi:SAM-dependent methyltransferase
MTVLHQFVYPRGLRGRFVGWLLAWFNRPMNAALVERLRLAGVERVLEVGFGPGVAIQMLSRTLPQGSVCGVDPSEVMLQQARRRNRAAVARETVDLRLGTASDLPWADATFDAILSSNNVQLWEPLQGSLSEVWRVMRPGGALLIGVHEWAARGQGGPLGRTLDDLQQRLPTLLTSNGWVSVKPVQERSRFGRSFTSVRDTPNFGCNEKCPLDSDRVRRWAA